MLQRLDDIIDDARVRATMPQTIDERIVIVDIDEKSLAEIGRWPWSRNRLAELVDEMFERQKAAMFGFDQVFAEADDRSELKRRIYASRQEAKSDVFDYIESFHNRVRRHSHLDQMSPLAFEQLQTGR